LRAIIAHWEDNWSLRILSGEYGGVVSDGRREPIENKASGAVKRAVAETATQKLMKRRELKIESLHLHLRRYHSPFRCLVFAAESASALHGPLALAGSPEDRCFRDGVGVLLPLLRWRGWLPHTFDVF
jgi:hypothetical protein